MTNNTIKTTAATLNIVAPVRAVSDSRDVEAGLKRRLNVFHGAALIVGATIGTGIFTSPAKIYISLGGAISGLLVWLLGAFIAFGGAMIYGEWACRVPQSGGDTPFLDRAYKRPYRMVSFLYSMARVFYINPGYIAIQAITFATYFSELPLIQTYLSSPSLLDYFISGVAIILVSLLSFVCGISNRFGNSFFLALTFMAIIVVFLIAMWTPLILLNIVKVKPTSNFSKNPFQISGTKLYNEAGNSGPLTLRKLREDGNIVIILGNIATSLLYGMWAYDGWANLSAAAGEITNPQRTIPLANFLGLSIIAVLYLLANVSYLLVVPIMDFSKTLLTDFTDGLGLFGHWGKVIAIVMAMTTTCSCCFTMIYSASRIAQATGETDLILFAKVFKKVNTVTKTPLNAGLATYFFSAMFCLLRIFTVRAFDLITESVSYLFWLFCAATVFGLFIVKFEEGSLFKKSKRTDVGLQVPFFVLLFVMIMIIFLLIFSWFSDDGSSTNYASWIVNLCCLCVPLLSLFPYLYRVRKGYISKKN